MDSNSFWKFYLICCRDANSGLRSGKESEAVRWSRIPNDTRGRSRIFCPTLTAEVQGSPIRSLLHHTPKLGIPVESVQFLMKLLLKQIILAVYHDFHWALVATKFLAAKLRSLCFNGKSWKGRSWGGNFERVGVGVRHFTSDSATLDAILGWWPLLAWSWWCNRMFVTGIFLLITNSQWG